ncbi:MAG TPA: response regulator [Vicinamibacterales bacterium]|nr:response regulator [Vicinamibacterales bacterium]
MTTSSARRTVLLVEDHADTRMFYAELFRGSFDVIEAGRGDRALQLAREQMPSLIITDIALPGITGIELAKALKGDEATAGIPIICLSGYADQETSDAVAASGIDRLLLKPCLPDDLLAHVNELMSQ